MIIQQRILYEFERGAMSEQQIHLSLTALYL